MTKFPSLWGEHFGWDLLKTKSVDRMQYPFFHFFIAPFMIIGAANHSD